MERKEKQRRVIIQAMAALAANEADELAKLRRLRTGLYWTGATIVAVTALLAGDWPVWITSLVAAAGGLVIGLGVHYDSSLNQWPTIKPFFDRDAVIRAASMLDDR